MKLKAEQLRRSLEQDSKPIYWLAGDEPLLMQEATDLVRSHFRRQGFTEREILNVDRGFNWEQFNQAYYNFSLFAEQKVIELRLSSNKLDDAGKQAVQDALSDPSSDNVILITSPKLDSSTPNTKWFKTIESRGVLVQIWPVNRENLPAWLEQRLMRAGIRAEPQALQLLLDKIEGNLLAAMQEIEKLKLLANNGSGSDEPIVLDSTTVMQVVADSSRYSAFQLVDAALLGDLGRAQKILNGLKAEDTFPLVILGSMTRELRSLLPMIAKRESGQGINAILQSSRVWFNRKQAVGNAINRLHTKDIWDMLDHAKKIDQSIKGMNLANPWDELSLLLADLAGKEPATAAMALR